MLTLKQAQRLVPPPDNKWELQKKDFDTQDIIDAIHLVDETYASETEELAKCFSLSKQGLRKLWEFVRYEIEYVADPLEREMVKSPAKTIHDGFGDCKSLSLLIGSILQNLGAAYTYKYTAYWDEYYRPSKSVTHIYPYTKLKGKIIFLDAVYPWFNAEAKYSWATEKEGHQPKPLAKVAGPPNPQSYVKAVAIFLGSVFIFKSINE